MRQSNMSDGNSLRTSSVSPRTKSGDTRAVPKKLSNRVLVSSVVAITAERPCLYWFEVVCHVPANTHATDPFCPRHPPGLRTRCRRRDLSLRGRPASSPASRSAIQIIGSTSRFPRLPDVPGHITTIPGLHPGWPVCHRDRGGDRRTPPVSFARTRTPTFGAGGTMATDPSMKARSCSIVRKRSVCRVTTILQFLPLRKWGGGGLGACSCSPGVGFGPSLHAHFTLDSSVK